MLQINDTSAHSYDVGELLAAEYSYIAGTAFQANEDRARVSQFFFITFGTFIAALFSSQLSNIDPVQLYLAFVFIFLGLAILGMLTILQLARLRIAWLHSVRAMNQIKKGAVKRYPYLEDYFKWTWKNPPKMFKHNSIGFYLATSVSILSGLATGAAAAFGSLAMGFQGVLWIPSIMVGVLVAIVQLLFLYQRPLLQADAEAK